MYIVGGNISEKHKIVSELWGNEQEEKEEAHNYGAKNTGSKPP
jgi:hypothetical protein